ncbi:hypothetical protein PPERSA_00444 [Pseudocohnilembus persalinus]|uniref:Uncharacterized protein n=1 Tax=Pseudocohnilembus persalinus TaxID=266149 RepID=A0A0V0R6Y1_PSEPJ|nr:hypothetical protein PPERSA_00444 [Pseudocohnilembus persalinus]|eukprot:KRX10247.1 hypothetical protein PPERSA_00444 [Pseudocohnilembus persalinus]
MYLKSINLNLNSKNPKVIQSLQQQLEFNNYKIIFEKEETLQDFIQILQQKVLNHQQHNNSTNSIQSGNQKLNDINDLNNQIIENLTISVLSSLTLENNYKNFPITQLFNLLSQLSTKIKQSSAYVQQQQQIQNQNSEIEGKSEKKQLPLQKKQNLKKCLTLGTIYLYIVKKIYPQLQDYNPTHKKIKQRTEDDSKHIVKLMQNVIDNLEPLETEMQNMLQQFMHYLAQIVKKFPNYFKNNKNQIESILHNNFVILNSENFSNFSSNQDLQNEAFEILSLLPNCVLKQIDYQENLRNQLDKYFYLYNYVHNLLQYSDNDISKINNNPQISQSDKSTIFQGFTAQNFSAFIGQEQCRRLVKLIKKILSNTKNDAGIELEIKNYLSILNEVLSSNLEFLVNQQDLEENEDWEDNFKVKKLQEKVLQISVSQALTLSLQDYQLFALQTKIQALQLFRKLTKIMGMSLSLHLDTIFNTVYQFIQNVLPQAPKILIKHTNKTLICLLQYLKVQASPLASYYAFYFIYSPLEIVLAITQNYNQMDKKQNVQSFQDEMQFTKKKKTQSTKSIQSLSFQKNTSSKSKEAQIVLTNANNNNIVNFINYISKDKNSVQEIMVSNLQFLSVFINISGVWDNLEPENISKIDALTQKIMLYHYTIAQNFSFSMKTQLFSFFEQVLLFNSLKMEDSLLLSEFQQFYRHYKKQESNQFLAYQLQTVFNKVQAVKLNKKISQVDNSMIISQYLDNLQYAFDNQQYHYQEIQNQNQQQDISELEKIQKKVKTNENQVQNKDQDNEGWENDDEQQQMSQQQDQKPFLQQQQQQSKQEIQNNNQSTEQNQKEAPKNQIEIENQNENKNEDQLVLPNFDDDEEEDGNQTQNQQLQQENKENNRSEFNITQQNNDIENEMDDIPKPCFD